METLFNTTLCIQNKNVPYKVVFEENKYSFLPENAESKTTVFSFVREHDEWHSTDNIAPGIKSEALAALEKYLLAQH